MEKWTLWDKPNLIFLLENLAEGNWISEVHTFPVIKTDTWRKNNFFAIKCSYQGKIIILQGSFASAWYQIWYFTKFSQAIWMYICVHDTKVVNNDRKVIILVAHLSKICSNVTKCKVEQLHMWMRNARWRYRTISWKVATMKGFKDHSRHAVQYEIWVQWVKKNQTKTTQTP